MANPPADKIRVICVICGEKELPKLKSIKTRMQEIIVYIILAIVAVVLIRYIYRQVTGKNRGCNCGSCPMNGGECHCHEK